MKSRFKQLFFSYTMLILLGGCSQPDKIKIIGLKDIFNADFYIGTALNENQIYGSDTSAIHILKKMFTIFHWLINL